MPSKITAQIAQWVVQQTRIQEVMDSNSADEQIFFSKIILFACMFFFKIQFDNTVTWHSKYALKRDLNKIKMHVIWELEYVDY